MGQTPENSGRRGERIVRRFWLRNYLVIFAAWGYLTNAMRRVKGDQEEAEEQEEEEEEEEEEEAGFQQHTSVARFPYQTQFQLQIAPKPVKIVFVVQVGLVR